MPDIELKVAPADLDLIYEALAELPHKKVAALINKIALQLQEQRTADKQVPANPPMAAHHMGNGYKGVEPASG
jgi:hypothetical protein